MLSLGDTNFVQSKLPHISSKERFNKVQTEGNSLTSNQYFSQTVINFNTFKNIATKNMKLVNRQGVPIITIRKEPIETQLNSAENTSMRQYQIGTAPASPGGSRNKDQLYSSQRQHGMLSQRLSPLRALETQREIRKKVNLVVSRDISYLREAKSTAQTARNNNQDQSSSRQLLELVGSVRSQGDNEAQRLVESEESIEQKSTRNIIIEEKQFSRLEKGGKVYPKNTNELQIAVKRDIKGHQRSHSIANLSLYGSVTNRFDKSLQSFDIKESAIAKDRSLSPSILCQDNAIYSSKLMLYPTFIGKYQSYQHSKNPNNQVEQTNLSVLDQQKKDHIALLRNQFNQYLETQTQHNLPLVFPQNQGMKQAFGMPTSRQQIEMLNNWFDDKLKHTVHLSLNKNPPGPDKMSLLFQDNDFQKELKEQKQRRVTQSKQIEELLEFMFQELINQVSIQCQQRGYLLEKVVGMLLGLRVDMVNQLQKEKVSINLKAVSQLSVLKVNHEYEIQQINQANQDIREKIQELTIINESLKSSIKDLQKEIDHGNIKRSQLKKMNNHLIDSLIIKQNQIRLANDKFKFKITNRDVDIASTAGNGMVSNTGPTPSPLGSPIIKIQNLNGLEENREKDFKLKVENVKNQIFSSRRSSKLFQQTNDQGMKQVQKQLRASISQRVEIMIGHQGQTREEDEDDDDDMDDYENISEYRASNLNATPQGSLILLQRSLRDQTQKLDHQAELDRNLKSLMKKKIKLSNLHNQREVDNFEVRIANDPVEPHSAIPKNLQKQKRFDQFQPNDGEQSPMIAQTPQALLTPKILKSRDSFIANNQGISNTEIKKFELIQEPTQQSDMIEEESSNLSLHVQNKIKEAQESIEELQEEISNDSSESDSNIEYSNKSMQFPEDDVLNYSDFQELQEQKAELPEVIIQKNQFVPDVSPQSRRMKPQKKFSKLANPYEEIDKKPLVIDLNLKKFDAESDLKKINETDPSQEHKDHVEIGQEIDCSSDSSLNSNPETPVNANEHTADADKPLNSKDKKKKQKEEFKDFMQGTDEQDVQKMWQNEGGLFEERKEELDDGYEQIDEKNSIFYQNNPIQSILQRKPSIKEQSNTKSPQGKDDKKTKDLFMDKVDTIVSLVLGNVNTKQISRKQLIQLVVSNILQNEQSEVKQLIMDQFFGQNEAYSGKPKRQSLNNFQKPQLLRRQSGGLFQLPTHLLLKQREQGIQTDPLLATDFLECAIEPAEIFKFDSKSQRLTKYNFHRDNDLEIVKVQEYVQKIDPMHMRLGMNRSSLRQEEKVQQSNPIQEKLREVATGPKQEIERCNIIMKELLWKIRELETHVLTLEEKKIELENDLHTKFNFKDRYMQQFDILVESWQKGFTTGFERGMSLGYFKGAVENKDFGIQEGFQLGIKEGWQIGFDDGFKNGIRKIYQEAKEKGIDVNVLTPSMHLYLSQQEKRQGIQLYIQQKLFKIDTFKALGPVVRRYLAKFNDYTVQKKKHYAKLGLKTVIKMIRQFFEKKITMPEILFSECVYEESLKKFGHNKMTSKAFMQFIASCHYHMNMHPKIQICASFLAINEKPFSIDVCNFYTTVLDSLNNTKIGVKNEYDEKTDRESISLAKAVEVMREQLEKMLPTEVILELRHRVEKLKIKGQQSKQPLIDLDKYMDFMLRSYIKFHIDLFNKPQLVYFSMTLYEINYIGVNELSMTLQVLSGDSLKLQNEQKEPISLMKKSLLKLFEEGCKEGDDCIIRYQQFHEIMKDSDLFKSKATREIFGMLPFRGHIQKFQEMWQVKSLEFKKQIHEIFLNSDITDRMDYLDPKEHWNNRIFAIERNIGEINTSLLYLSVIMMQRKLEFLHEYKNTIVKALWEERNHGKKMPQDANSQKLFEDLINQKKVGQFQEKNIKQAIQSKVNEVSKNASPTFLQRKSNSSRSSVKLPDNSLRASLSNPVPQQPSHHQLHQQQHQQRLTLPIQEEKEESDEDDASNEEELIHKYS